MVSRGTSELDSGLSSLVLHVVLSIYVLNASFADGLIIWNWWPRPTQPWYTSTTPSSPYTEHQNTPNYQTIQEATSTESALEYFLSSESTTQSVEPEEPKYSVYWNVPTFQCHKYGLNFSQVSEWGIEQNYGDEFRGQAIAILYDPGEYPALLTASSGYRVARNGGVPQEGSLTRHLALFKAHIEKLIPDPQFSGLGIIDFEHWRPVWKQNWGSLLVYREFSRQLERKRHPFWFSAMIESEASFKYEIAARTFLVESIRLARSLRPLAKWGYYGYPFCFNFTPKNNRASCSDDVVRDNNGMSWMFNEVTSHYPSLYLREDNMYPRKRRRFVDGRLDESLRIADQVPVYPYIWYNYHDSRKFLTKEDMRTLLARPKSRGCRGAVIWGSSKDVNTRDKCFALFNYLNDVIGPIVRRIQNQDWRDSEEESTTISEEEPEDEEYSEEEDEKEEE